MQFPSTALSTQILRPRFTCEASNSSPASKLLDLQEALSNHDFNSEKSRKRKRDGKAVQQSQEQEDTGLLIQGFLEAVTLVDDSPAKSNTGESILRITINGLLHSSLAQILLKQLM